MADYIPRYLNGDSITLMAAATLTGGQLVLWNGTVAGSAAVGVAGVAGSDKVSGQPVTVWRNIGPHIGTASGTIAIGDPLCAGAAGTLRTWVSGTDPASSHIGTAASAATNGQPVTYSLHSV